MNTSNKIVVHCKTEEEAIDFCKQMDEHGLKWRNRDSYLEENNWNIYKEKTCYDSDGSFGTKNISYINYTILEWSDYIKKYPIDYLKYGYVVKFADGRLAMYMPSREGDCFDYGCGCYSILFNDYDKDLKHWNSDYDVKRIYGYSNHIHNTLQFDIKDRTIIWERPEVKKMTVAEICKELGYKVEIIAED